MLTEPENGAPPQSICPLLSEKACTVLRQYNPVFEETQVRFAFRATLVARRPRPDITRGLHPNAGGNHGAITGAVTLGLSQDCST